jgi:hypothetical protein
MFFNNIYEVTTAIRPFYTEISKYCGKLSVTIPENDRVNLFIKCFFRYCNLKNATSGTSLQPFVSKLLQSATDVKLQFIITYMANSPLAVFYREYSHNPKFQEQNIIHIFTPQPPLFTLFSLIGTTNETITSALFSQISYLTKLSKEILNNDRLKPYFQPYFKSYQKEETESLNAHEKRVTRYFIEDYFPEVLQGAYYPKNVYEVENRVNPIATASDVAAVFNSLIEYINDSAQAKRSKRTFDRTLTAAEANDMLGRFIDSNKEKLVKFKSLELKGVKLHTLPEAIKKLRGLKVISIEDCEGFNLPSWLWEMQSLEEITLNKNSLGGRIPLVLCELPNIYHLDLSENQLTGNIPTELGDLNNLVTLDLSKNQLTGNIPTELGELYELEDLYLHCNQLSGPIPPELITSNLSTLYLYNNKLTGRIPSVLFDYILDEHVVNFEGNSFDGDVPESFYDATYKLPAGNYRIGLNGEFIPLEPNGEFIPLT